MDQVVGTGVDPTTAPPGEKNESGRPSTRMTKLKDFRTVKVKGSKSRAVVGVSVSFNIDLAGLRGKPLWLSWSLWQKSSGERIFGDWLNEYLAYEIVADTEHDTTGGNFWIPLPATKGTFYVRATISSGEVNLTSTNSPPFS